MPLTNAGRDFIAAAIIDNGTPTHYDEANAAIGVGDSSTAFAVAQTDLQAASNKVRVGMDVSYPTISTNTLTFRSTFNPGTGNFAWEEWGVFNNTTGGTMLSRKVESLGTKSASQTWQVTIDLDVLVGA